MDKLLPFVASQKEILSEEKEVAAGLELVPKGGGNGGGLGSSQGAWGARSGVLRIIGYSRSAKRYIGSPSGRLSQQPLP